MIMTAAAFTAAQRENLPQAMKGNLCRCTGYTCIRNAIAGKPASPPPALPPAARAVVTGAARFTMDVAIPGLLHLKLLRSPHAHARIRAIDTTQARALPGVHRVLTYEDSPDVLFSSARHENPEEDPDDTCVFDAIMRFVGQRAAAVVADTPAIAEAACRLINVDYEILPAVVDPLNAAAPHAPQLHEKPNARIQDPTRNIAACLQGGCGDISDGLAKAAAIYEGEFITQRVQHAALETHATIGWLDEAGRLNLRTSTQVPFLIRDTIARIYNRPASEVRVVCERVGGGFGGKQEMLLEDVVALAVLRTGRPVRLELSRAEQFATTTSRHSFRVGIRLGAARDGTLTAIDMDVVSDTGAYGNHAAGVLFHSCTESVAVYRCANKRLAGRAVYTNTPPTGAFRGYGLSQTNFAVESAIDALAAKLGIDPIELRFRNMIRPGDAMVSFEPEPADLHIGSYGLDQCLALVRDALVRARPSSPGPEWRTGEGVAIGMIETTPPNGHRATAKIRLLPDGSYELSVGTAEFGNGTTTVHAQLAAAALATTPDRIHIRQSDTDLVPHDTGAYGSTGTVVAGLATQRAAMSLATQIRTAAASALQLQTAEVHLSHDAARGRNASITLETLAAGHPDLEARGQSIGSPRSVAFNAQGFKVAVHPRTGLIRILHSVHAADAGTVINRAQCIGQIQGGVAQAIGAALYEELRLGPDGAVTNPAPLRRQANERIPLYPGCRRTRQRHRGRHRYPLASHAVRRRPDFPPVRQRGAGRMTTLLVRNATILVTMDAARREIPGGGLFARDGVIEQVGATLSLPATADHILDATDQIVLPGLVNCHHHMDQILTRNLPAGQNAELFDWLRAHYTLGARRTPEASRTATLIALAELALSGCTTAFDHAYVFCNGCQVDDQIAAAAEIGVRFMISRGSMSRGQSKGGLPPDSCVENEEDILADCERVIDRYHDPAAGALLRIVLAPCSPFSVTGQLLKDSATLARAKGVRLHTHLCETVDEEHYTLAQHGVRPMEYMRGLDWVADDVWFAHAVVVNDSDISLLAHTGAGVCHCPTSNMRLASGIAPLRHYLEAGVHVGLGVDGSASNDGSNMLAEARQAMLLARLRMATMPTTHRVWTSARDVLEVATRGGAAVLGRNDIGALEPGSCADFFTLDLNTIGFAGGLSDPVAAAIFCAPQPARHTYVHGRPIVTDGRIVTLDMERVVHEHNVHAARLLACPLLG